ncbi:MAG: menaquinone biosynthesis protein [Chloroflexi bacterium]|jgi:chorismate dehydratase|nr:menaquinone biosynthesis protein [Chloroflexota bacterium]MDA1281762.1 menaquinone biosynthesis protein [Chloroflexota bacterium]
MTTKQSDSLKLRVGHMTYLNSEVFYRKLPLESCALVALPPRAMAAAVESGELHAGPLPIAEVLRMGEKVQSLGEMGVACYGAALSVFLFSNSPVEELSGSNIAVTAHTATSIQLLRVLFADLWNVSNHRFVEMSDDHDAELIIGDPALEKLSIGEFQYHYDLGSAWKKLTGLPFVFAEWVIRSDSPQNVRENFERILIESTKTGMNSIDEIVRIRSSETMSESDVEKYVRNFTYFLGPDERAGQYEFKSRLSKLPEWRPSLSTPAKSSAKKAISTSI